MDNNKEIENKIKELSCLYLKKGKAFINWKKFLNFNAINKVNNNIVENSGAEETVLIDKKLKELYQILKSRYEK